MTWNENMWKVLCYRKSNIKCTDSEGEEFGTLPLTGSYGIDYLIGEESQLGKGLGKGMVTLLIDRIFSLPDARSSRYVINRKECT